MEWVFILFCKLRFEKVAAPTNINVTNSTLSFTNVENTAFYELYEQTGTSLNLINKITNSYDISSVEGEKTFVLKSISKEGGFTNSTYSAAFTLNKLSAPQVESKNGRVYITLSEEVKNVVKPGVSVTLNIIKHNGSNLNIDFVYDESKNTIVLANALVGVGFNGSAQRLWSCEILRSKYIYNGNISFLVFIRRTWNSSLFIGFIDYHNICIDSFWEMASPKNKVYFFKNE